MRKELSKKTFSYQRFMCRIFGHNYLVSKKITNHISEYKCTVCKKEITDTIEGKVENLTYQNKTINKKLASFFRKKRKSEGLTGILH